MRKIEMVDLKSQYQHLKADIDEAIQNVINSAVFIKGSEVFNFENELANYLGVQHVISCGNGTDALQIALMGLGLQKADEIITSDFTFISTAETIGLLGFDPVFAEVDTNTFNISPSFIEKVITSRTKAIVPVHLFGQCSDMDEIMRIASEYHLQVVEDAAQALGAEYTFADGAVKKAGTIGKIGCTSFFPSKNLGCYGDGGAIFTNDDELAENLRSIANHGMKVRYYHERLGVNSRLDAIQAAILRVKLRHLDEYNQARQKVADFYDHAFAGLPELMVPQRNPHSTHIFNQYTLVLEDSSSRDHLKEFLNSKEIPSMIYYPVPLHLQNAFKYLGYGPGDFPDTERLCKSVISLPMHTELDEEQLDFITKSVLEFFGR
ncbi:MAG: DegT/DnrJ/EryC1/StrS family aminotransferase [Bacteroidota bacterium]|nr:DegT/DnrJ/EryC1/StrS family aminotransferase [Bacteroidota bacterium]